MQASNCGNYCLHADACGLISGHFDHLPILSAKKSKPPRFTTHPRLVLKLQFIEDEEEDSQELKPYNSVDFVVEFNFLHVGACSCLIDGHSNQYACERICK